MELTTEQLIERSAQSLDNATKDDVGIHQEKYYLQRSQALALIAIAQELAALREQIHRSGLSVEIVNSEYK